jgi:hypothetical protein
VTTIAIPSAAADLLRTTSLPVRLVDEQGNLLGSFAPAVGLATKLTQEELDQIKARMKAGGPRYTTEQVLEFIDSRSQR